LVPNKKTKNRRKKMKEWLWLLGGVISAILAIIVYNYYNPRLRTPTVPATPTSPPTTTTPAVPPKRKSINWSKIWWKVIKTIIVLVLAGLIILAIRWVWINQTKIGEKINNGLRVEKSVRPTKMGRWVYTWTLPEGQTQNGYNGITTDRTEVVRDDNVLYIVIHSKNTNSGQRIGSLYLNKVDEKLIGTWSDHLTGDFGRCEFSKTTERVWSGFGTDRRGNIATMTLENRK
jgi:hypothetical protein